MITLIRVDDRVIHGQTIACWLAQCPCDGILIVDDALSQNKQMLNIYRNTVPSGIRVFIFSTEKAMVKIPEASLSDKFYFVIFRSVLTLQAYLLHGGEIKGDINVGPASGGRPGAQVVVPTIALTKEEVDAYRYIAAQGYSINLQIVPAAKKTMWCDIEKKL